MCCRCYPEQSRSFQVGKENLWESTRRGSGGLFLLLVLVHFERVRKDVLKERDLEVTLKNLFINILSSWLNLVSNCKFQPFLDLINRLGGELRCSWCLRHSLYTSCSHRVNPPFVRHFLM